MLSSRGITLSAENVRLSGSRPGRGARSPAVPGTQRCDVIAQLGPLSVRTGTRGSGSLRCAKHVASISLSSLDKSPSSPSFLGICDSEMWVRAQAGTLGSLERCAPHLDVPGLAQALCTTRKWLLDVAWPPAVPPLLANLTLPFPRLFATVWTTVFLLGRISNRLTPGPAGCHQGHRANGRLHSQRSSGLRSQVSWAPDPQPGPFPCRAPEAPWPYQSEA